MTKNRETILDVSGMTCPSCIRHVDAALKALEGVDEVDVRLREGKVRVQHDPAAAPVNSLIAAIVYAGYEAKERVA